MNVAIYYRDEDDEYQTVVVPESEALDKVRSLLNDGGNVITGISQPYNYD